MIYPKNTSLMYTKVNMVLGVKTFYDFDLK